LQLWEIYPLYELSDFSFFFMPNNILGLQLIPEYLLTLAPGAMFV